MTYSPGGQSVQGQPLDITVVGCYNLTNKEWFTKQDPYVIIEYSGQKLRSRTHTGGIQLALWGLNPSFNESFKISLIEGLREINASVWNSNTFERDDYIGSTKILLSKVIDSGYDDTQWPLTNSRNGKSSGMLKLILHYAGAKTKPSNPEGSSYPNAAPPTPGFYGQPASPAYGQFAVPAYGPAYYPPQQFAACPPPQVPAQPYVAMYQAPTYPPTPVAYIAPAAPALYHSVSAPPTYNASAPPYPTHPPAVYPPSTYPPAGYPQYR